jgi:hypothetical protein
MVHIASLLLITPQLVTFLSVPQPGWPIILNPAVNNPNHTGSAAPAAGSNDTDARLDKANKDLAQVTKELGVARHHATEAQAALANASSQPVVAVDDSQIEEKEREVRVK